MPIELMPSRIGTLADGMARIALQVEMKRQDVSYEDLTERLILLGAKENVRNLRNKVARGTFSAGFLILCLIAMGTKTLTLEFNRKILEELGIE